MQSFVFDIAVAFVCRTAEKLSLRDFWLQLRKTTARSRKHETCQDRTRWSCVCGRKSCLRSEFHGVRGILISCGTFALAADPGASK